MKLRPLVVVALVSSFAVACGSASVGEPAAGGDGEDVASADTIANGSAVARNFVEPSLSDAEAAQVLARYSNIDTGHVIAPNLLRDALLFYDVNQAHIPNQGYIAIVDFALNSGTKRFFLVGMQSGTVWPHMVAHGSGSEDGKGNAKRFSNVDGTHESALGFILTGETYSGVHGRSLRLDGLSTTDSNMRSRAIVIHSAAYVSESSHRQGNSWGCFALDAAVKDTVVDALKGGALMYSGIGDPHASPLPSGPSNADAGVACVTDDDCPNVCIHGVCK